MDLAISQPRYHSYAIGRYRVIASPDRHVMR
jgi:hypothetical protein